MNHVANTSPTANVSFNAAPTLPRANFSARDFGKLFAAAVGSGVVVSLAAAALALALAGTADAATHRVSPRAGTPAMPQPAPRAAFEYADESAPGALFLGGACDREVIDTAARDLQIRIDGTLAEIRVMQSFVMPADGPTTAFFEAVLPRGATLKSLKAHAPRHVYEAALAQPAPRVTSVASVRKPTRRAEVTMWLDAESNTLQTEHIPHLVPGEVVTIEYTYTLSVAENAIERLLNLTLSQPKDSHDPEATTRPLTTPVSVWVEWKGAKPKQLRGLSGDFALETAVEGVFGLAWHDPAVVAGHKLSLSWDAPSAIAQRD
jgi:hypothetical protein